MDMITRKEWKEFRESGLLWWINRMLHLFGWAICVNIDESDEVTEVYPAKVKFRGFDSKSEDEGFIKLSKHIKAEADRLVDESQL